MEGIGAAEIVLIHQKELRDSLVRQRSNKQPWERLAGSGWRPRGGVLVRLLSGWASWRRTAYTDAGLASVSTRLARNGVHTSPERDARRQINERVRLYSAADSSFAAESPEEIRGKRKKMGPHVAS